MPTTPNGPSHIGPDNPVPVPGKREMCGERQLGDQAAIARLVAKEASRGGLAAVA